MNALESMREQIVWLGRADTFSVDLFFGPVCDAFRETYLSGKKLCPEVAHYFDYCIPASVRTRDDYDVPELIQMDTYGSGDFRAYDGEAMIYHVESGEWGTNLMERGYIEIGNTWSGSPYFVQLTSGAVRCVPSTSITREGKLRRYVHDPIREEILPFSDENLCAFAEYKFPSLTSFFQTLYERERVESVKSIWWCIKEHELDHLKRTLALDLDFNVVNDDGLTPVEYARRTGNSDVIKIVEAHFDSE